MTVQSLSYLEQNFYPCLIPRDYEMYAKNSGELKNAELCPFLQKMDDQERDIQKKTHKDLITEEEKGEGRCRVEIAVRSFGQVVCDPIAGACGAIFGWALGPIGAIAFGGILGAMSHGAVLMDRAQRHKAMDAGRPRINRLVNKIEKIKEKQLKLDLNANTDQLNKAKAYFQNKVDRYNLLYKCAPSGSSATTSLGHTSSYYDREGNYHISGTVTFTKQYNAGGYTVTNTTTSNINT